MGRQLCCCRSAALNSRIAFSRSSVVGSRSFSERRNEGTVVMLGVVESELWLVVPESPLLHLLMAGILELDSPVLWMSILESGSESFLFFDARTKSSNSLMWQTEEVDFVGSSDHLDTSSIVLLILSRATAADSLRMVLLLSDRGILADGGK